MKKKLVMCCAFLLYGAVLFPESLTLDSAIASALANNADVQKSLLSLEQAARNKDYGWNLFLPKLSNPSLSLSHNHQLAPQTTGPSSAADSWAWGSLSIGASLSFSADVPNQLKLLDAKYRQAAQTYESAQRTLTVSVSTGFYSLLGEQLNIDILANDVEVKRTQYETVGATYRRGLASELDLLNAEYAYRTAGPTLKAAIQKYQENRAAFCILIGIDPKTEPVLEGEIEIRTLALHPIDELARRYLMARSDVQAQQNALEQAKLNAASRITQGTPSLSFQETLSLSPESGAGLAFGDPALSGRFSISLTLPLGSWIPYSSDDINRRNDKNTVTSAELSLEAAWKTAEQDIWKKVNAVLQNAEALESSDLNHRIAVRAYELSDQGYRAGLVSQTDLQTANQRQVTAGQAVVTAKIAYLTALYNLASALTMDIVRLYESFGT
jgi:multidrug efflux system outer membrane protein